MSSDQEQDVEMGEQEVQVPKRGRGRPKKTAAKKTAEEKSDEPAVKRGRGRPPAGAPKAKAEKPTKAKKTETEEDADAGNGDVEEAGKAPPKRRGRKAAQKEKEPEPEPEESDEDAESVDEDSAPAPPAKTKGVKGGKKATKNGHANGEEKEDDDAADEEKSEKSEESSSDSRIKIVVEHCKSCHTYRKKAEDIITALKEKWSNIDVEYNPKPPKKGSFEITLVNNGNDVKLWTGLELGPPRKLKFPETEKVVEAMEKAYVPESA